MSSWYEDREFWDKMSPRLFSKSHWETASEEIDSIITLTGIQPGSSVLDLCCGPGRHSIELARRDINVTAVDLTETYLEEAKTNAKNAGMTVEFIREDMRYFKRTDNYDAIMMMYTSFGYFENQEENMQVLSNCFHSLTKEGSLIIDVMGKEIVARIFQEREWHQEDDTLYLEERKVLNDWSKIENRWIMLRGTEKHEFIFTHWLYSASELSDLLYASGFKSISIYGNLKGGKYDHQAERLIAVAKK